MSVMTVSSFSRSADDV